VGQGMGLGLSLSYGILLKIHGSIVVESELGKGAEFVVRIPKDFRELA
jgi:signal transduction histidine kinase